MNLKKTLVLSILSCILAACETDQSDTAEGADKTTRIEQTVNGIIVSPLSGEAKKVRLQVVRDDIIRITASPSDKITTPESIMVVAEISEVPFLVNENDNVATLSTDHIKVEVSLENGAVKFYRPDGELLLASADSGDFEEVTRDPITPASDSFAIKQSFMRGEGEAYYGLGQHQNGQVNLADENVYLTTHNLIITIP